VDWSEILTQGEAEFMQGALCDLQGVPWAVPLVREIANRGGLTFENKPLLFEARVAYMLHTLGVTDVDYEFAAGVGDSTVDFRFGRNPEYLVEVVSIGRSAALERATFHSGSFFGSLLSSPRRDQPDPERQQSEEGESLLAVQKIGEKVHDGRTPIKFPSPQADRYHVVLVDMRAHLGGGDIYDWRQIALGAEAGPLQYSKRWLDKHNQPIPLRGVWHPQNSMRFSQTARERLHAILFIAEKRYAARALTEGGWIACNPHLFAGEDDAKAAFAAFPLRPVPRASSAA
jgi:hypothetical protein